MSHLKPEEQDAADLLMQVLHADQIVPRDVAGAPSQTHDFDFVTGSHCVAVEVTRAMDTQLMKLHAQVGDGLIYTTATSGAWLIYVTDSTDVKVLRSSVDALVADVEADNLWRIQQTQFGSVRARNQRGSIVNATPAAHAMASAGVRHAIRITSPGVPGRIYLHPPAQTHSSTQTRWPIRWSGKSRRTWRSSPAPHMSTNVPADRRPLPHVGRLGGESRPLAVARDLKAGWDVRRHGLAAGPMLTAYASAAVHDTVPRGADLIGMGYEAVRMIPVDHDDHADVAAMHAAIKADLAAGHRPICVIGTAGTVGTGVVDDLAAIADLADEFDLWFHVDGAVGAVGALVDGLRDRFTGIARADSISLDPHKWLYVPIACGMLLVRDDADLSRAFHIDPSYTVEDKDRMRAGVDTHIRSPFFTRHAAALKLWWSLRAHGWDAYERRMIHDCELARYLRDLADAHPRLEVTSDPKLMIATFRYVPADNRAPEEVDQLNQRIMERLQYSGRVYASNAVVGGRFVLRACIVNFRSEAEDIEALIDLTAAIGDELSGA